MVAGYDVEADTLGSEYERLSFEEIHAPMCDLLPESAGCILDVGAGSGRDAAWFAGKGHKVVAVEPSTRLREAGKERHPSRDIRWMDDALPALDRVLRSKLTFDLIWLSGVWMRVPRRRTRPGLPQVGLGDDFRRQYDGEPPSGRAGAGDQLQLGNTASIPVS